MTEKKENKKYNFTDTERSLLQHLEINISIKESETTLVKNMYNGVVDGALKRCGVVPEKLLEEGKKINIDVYTGTFEIQEPEPGQNKPPSKSSIILP